MQVWAAKGEDIANLIDLENMQSKHNSPPLEKSEGEGWTIADGRVSEQGRPKAPFNSDGVESLTYNNPLTKRSSASGMMARLSMPSMPEIWICPMPVENQFSHIMPAKP